MTKKEIFEWLADLFIEMPQRLNKETILDELGAWDSLSWLTLIAELDERFNIQLVDNDIQKLKTIKDIMDLLDKHGHLHPEI